MFFGRLIALQIVLFFLLIILVIEVGIVLFVTDYISDCSWCHDDACFQILLDILYFDC